jgi:hypothetical protein
MPDEPGKVTIQSLEVSFHVDGDDRSVFTKLFREHIAAWEEAKEKSRTGEREQSLGDRSGEDQPL